VLGLFMKLRMPDAVLEEGDVGVHNEEVYPSETLTRAQGELVGVAPGREPDGEAPARAPAKAPGTREEP
jgi:Amt family ammonium transporter